MSPRTTVRSIFLLVLLCCSFVSNVWAQGFSVVAGASALTIHPGDSNVAMPVSLSGDGTYSGPVTVTLTGLPSGIAVLPVVLMPGSSGTLMLSASVAADQEAFPAVYGTPDTATSIANVVAFAGAQRSTASFSLTVSLENPSFAPQASDINLPIVRIDTDGVAIVDKTTNVPGTITVTSASGQTSYLPGILGTDNTATFHLHGNSTALLPKQPYHVKLNTSTDLLTGMGLQCGYVTSAGKPVCDKSKSYILLANYDDKTLLRDWSASALANAIPIGGEYLGGTANTPSPSGTSTVMPWAPHSLFIELYVNGRYEGNYQLIEEVKVDSHRVNITEMANTDTSGTALTGGYLMEIDQRRDEDYTGVTPHGVYIGLEDPDFAPEVPEQTSYISNYVVAAEASLYSSNFTDPSAGWRAYFDEASVVNFYLVNDLFGNVDGGAFYSSDYLYKDRNNPLIYMGPVWDFDVSSGNVNYAAIVDATVPWMQTQSPWYAQLFTDPSFKAAGQQQWNTLKKNGIFSTWLSSISGEAAILEQSQRNNFGRWPMQGICVWPNPQANGSYDGEVTYFKNWVTLRMAYMDAFFNNLPPTTTTLTVPSGTLRTGTPATLIAKVTGDSPTGTVTFSYNSIVIGQATLDSTGTATFAASTIAPGNWTIEAYYDGDSKNSLSAAPGSSASVLPPLTQTTVNLTASGTFSYGSPVTLTAAVVATSGSSVPTGTFTFVVNGNTLGSMPVSASGMATLVTSTLPSGADVVQVSYSGDSTYAASTSNSVSETVATATATVTLGNLSATYNGGPQALTATTQPSGLSYTVSYNGASVAPSAAGTYVVVATINDANYTGSASGTLTVAKAAATVTLASLTATYNGSPQVATATTQPSGLSYTLTYNGGSAAPSAVGTYNVVATVTDPNYTGTATGTLTITKSDLTVTLGNLNATYNGSPQTVTVVTQPSGLHYTLTYSGASTAPSASGTYNVVATVNDSGYLGSASGTLTIAKAAATVTLGDLNGTYNGSPQAVTVVTQPSGLNYSITYNGASSAPSAPGTYNVVATVDDLNYTGTTSGTLTIAKAIATVTLANLTGTYNGSPQAVTATTQPSGLYYTITYNGAAGGPSAAGTYNVVATVDDAHYAGSANGILTVAQAIPTVSWPAPAAIIYGTPLSAIQLNAASSVPGSFSYIPTSGTVLSVGSQTLSVTLVPTDGNAYTEATGSVQIVVNKQASSTTVTTSGTSIVPNQALTLNAKIAGATSGIPSGTVSFFDGTSLLGTTVVVNGMATYSTTTLVSGSHTLTAAYSGDTNYLPSTSSTEGVAVSVAPLAFTFTSNGSSSVTIGADGSASLSYSLAPMYGSYPGQVSFSVTGLPSTLQYTIAPSVVAANAGPANVVVTIADVNSTTAIKQSKNPKTSVLAFLLLGPIVGAGVRRRVRSRLLPTLSLAIGCCVVMSNLTACGGQPTEPGQTYHLTLIATSGAIQQSTSIDVTVR